MIKTSMSKSETLNPLRGDHVEGLLRTQNWENIINLYFYKMGLS